MNCPECNKEIVADKLFCNWCEAYIPNPSIGKKSGLFRRWLANFIDPAIASLLYFIVALILGAVLGISGGAAASTMGRSAGVLGGGAASFIAFIIVTFAYGGFFFWFLSKGMTLGKWILGEKVVEKLTGNHPGFWRMILREVIGKFVSGLCFGLGYFWAIWDKDSQAWHDKIAGTVVVRK